MNSRISRKAITLFLSAAVGLGLLAPTERVDAGPDAKGIMQQVSETRKLDASQAVVKMTIGGKDGKKRERKLSMASKLVDGGKTEKRIYRFLDPADVKGTGVLVFDYADKDDDMWIYLPALRKTRRIVSSQRSKSFMGSEFSYGDLNIPALDDYKYKHLKSENAGGEDCHVIEVLPKNDKVAESEGYSKKIYWVSKAKNTIRKGVYYDLDGEEVKELTTSDVKLLDPKHKRYRPMKMVMKNKANHRESTFETQKVSLDAPKDDLFTTSYLERQ